MQEQEGFLPEGLLRGTAGQERFMTTLSKVFQELVRCTGSHDGGVVIHRTGLRAQRINEPLLFQAICRGIMP